MVGVVEVDPLDPEELLELLEVLELLVVLGEVVDGIVATARLVGPVPVGVLALPVGPVGENAGSRLLSPLLTTISSNWFV